MTPEEQIKEARDKHEAAVHEHYIHGTAETLDAVNAAFDEVTKAMNWQRQSPESSPNDIRH